MTRTFFDLRQEFLTRLGNYTPEERLELFYIFAEEILGLNRQEILFKRRETVDETVFRQFREIVDELSAGKPYQQITGKAEFFGMAFTVNEHVLIPRPETEELLEFAIRKIQEKHPSGTALKILDIGTGSGIIPVILKKHFPEADISAVDISEKALETARKNADLHKTEIRFGKMDFLTEHPDYVYDIIISNPPYIGRDEFDEIADSVKQFEPQNALFPPVDDALIFYRKIAEEAQSALSENGMIFLEINQKLGSETLKLFKTFKNSEIIRDISGNDRIIFAEK